VVTIGFKKAYKFHKEKLEEEANAGILEESAKEVWGRSTAVKLVYLEDDAVQDPLVKKALDVFGEDIVEIKE
jgi:DNA polymerase-3 subunit gamma/tau